MRHHRAVRPAQSTGGDARPFEEQTPLEDNFCGGGRILRINEAPRRTMLDLVESTAAPAGVGEPGVPPVAPAIANAIFALTGTRIRELPLVKSLSV